MKQIHWYPGHMAKTKREIEEKLNIIDIVLELRDARIPFASCNPELDRIISKKFRLVLLTKYDIADKTETQKWIDYYASKGIQCLCISSVTKYNLDKILEYSKDVIKEQIEKDISKGLKERSIRALVVGIPNVGKSTFINSVSKRKAAKVGDKAGVTKSLQWIKLPGLDMLDSPGMLWPKIEDEFIALHLACTSSINLSVMPKDDIAVYALEFLHKYYKDALQSRYDLSGDTDYEDIEGLYESIGRRRGCIIRGNNVDYEKVTDIIINDIRLQKFGNITFDRFEHFDIEEQ